MGIFNFFKKKNVGPAVKTLVWVSAAAKQKGCADLLQNMPGAIVIAWFPETQRVFQAYFQRQGLPHMVLLARQTTSLQLNGKKIVLLERYPLYHREHDFLVQLQDVEITALVSMDEPLMLYFGGERLISLMGKMGMDENEAMEHTMINSAIENAQKKLDGRVLDEQGFSQSMEEWFQKNNAGKS